ncbi:MAG: carboxypeptidase regulatory-like domain-containing protein [Candidatus Acidiferrales bacterium]
MVRLSSFLHCCSFLILLLLAFATTAAAQNNATLQGTVTDPSGAAVPNANVTVMDQATGVIRQTKTTSTGFYQVAQLPPSQYTVTIEATGFQKSQTTNVTVLAEQFRGLEVVLQLGGTTQSVTVNGANQALLQTEDASISGTLTAPQVERLPEFGRDVYELLRLSPGIFGDGERNGAGLSVGFPNGPGSNAGSGGPGGSNTAIFQTENQQSISADGQRITANDYMVDGVSVNSLEWGGAAVITPSLESVQEMTVLSNDYDAADGRNSGAHIKIVTKNGTNKFHGTGFFQYQTPGLNAYNKFNGPGTPDERVDNAFRQFGGNLGGPVIHNKLFFFFNYEGLRSNSSTYDAQWVDTPQLDALIAGAAPNTPVSRTLQATGLAPRIDRLLTGTCTSEGGAPITFPIPCQNVPGGVNLGSPTGTYGQYVDATPNGGGFTSIPEFEYAELSSPALTSGDQYNARVDYDMGRSIFSASTFLTFYRADDADDSSQDRPMDDYKTDRFSPSGFLSWVFASSPSLINDLRFNFTRYAFNDVAANPQIDWEIPRTEIQSALPNGARVRYGSPQGDDSPGIFAQNTFAFRDMVTKIHGEHAVKVGFDYDHEQDNDDLLGSSRPDYVFNGPWDFTNGAPIYEAINVDPATGGPEEAARYYRESDYGVFVQDDWKFRPDLTLNLGLRWDYYGPPSEARGNLENIIPGSSPISGLVFARAVFPGHMYNATMRNFGPRIGFAWSPSFLHAKTVVRGGFGIAYDRFDDDSFNNTRDNPPLVASYGICCAGPSNPFLNGQILYETGTSDSPLGFAPNPALATPIDPSTNLPVILAGQSAPNVYANPIYMPVPYVYLYSLQVQQALPGKWVATVGYQGSSSHDLLRVKNLIYFYSEPATEIDNVYSFTPDTEANFNALLTQLQHQFNNGVMLNFAYTYSKSIDDVSAEGPGFTTNQTYPIDLATERGPSDFDATHQLSAYGLWDLPIFRHRNDFLGKTLGGWQINGIFEFHSGFPWTPVADNICPVLGASTLCPLRPIGYNGGAGDKHNTEAFLPPATGQLTNPAGNFPNPSTSYFTLQQSGTTPDFPGIGRNSFRGPRYSDIDFSLMKEFGLPNMAFIGETAKLQVRANFFNAFNKLNLAPFTFGSNSTVVSYGPAVNPSANTQFGTATSGLAGRVVELEGRFVF